MLQRDYILEVIDDFTSTVTAGFGNALETQSEESLDGVEAAVAELIDLSPETALALSPDSLVTMMLLSGVADSVAEYVVYALDRLSHVYKQLGDEDKAGLRRQQAVAVAQSFSVDQNATPEQFKDFEAKYFA
jgi:hypothetical protein